MTLHVIPFPSSELLNLSGFMSENHKRSWCNKEIRWFSNFIRADSEIIGVTIHFLNHIMQTVHKDQSMSLKMKWNLDYDTLGGTQLNSQYH